VHDGITVKYREKRNIAVESRRTRGCAIGGAAGVTEDDEPEGSFETASIIRYFMSGRKSICTRPRNV